MPVLDSGSGERGSSKALAGRVTTAAGLDPHPITGRVWRVTGIAVLITIVACGAYIGVGGDSRAFQTRNVASVHEGFEQQCSNCHTTWAPAHRLLGTFTGGDVHSVTNEKCEHCHRGELHHQNQFPGHLEVTGEYLSCASCHREHRGDVDLARTASEHCTACHVNLNSHTYAADGSLPGDSPFEGGISGFEVGQGHPEFALLRRLWGEDVRIRDAFDDQVVRREPPPEEIGPIRLPPEEAEPTERVWHDRGRIRFNHFAHLWRPLPVRADRENRERWGDRRKCYSIEEGMEKVEGQWRAKVKEIDCEEDTQLMVQLDCDDCHTADADGRYMLSIDYTQHCRMCHQIRFDVENFPDVVVPHAAIAEGARQRDRERPATGMDVLRGFLAEKYATAAANPADPGDVADPDRSRREELLDLPGRPTRSLLTADQRKRVAADVKAAGDELMRELNDEDLRLLRSTLSTIGETARGGCRFCHVVEKAPQHLGGFEIIPPRIPDRWMSHSRFDHAAHRDMICADCHFNPIAPEEFRDVRFSANTADVLMPPIAKCRECHSTTPTNDKGVSARSDCVECHIYHDHSRDPFDVGAKSGLGPIKGITVP